jgi:hypothetical protein
MLGLAFSTDGPEIQLIAAAYRTGTLSLPDLHDIGRRSGGLDTFALLCVQSRKAAQGSEAAEPVKVRGGENSPASRLYRTFDEKDAIKWPENIFGTHRQYQHCVMRGRPDGVYEVYLKPLYIPPDSIEVWLDEERVSESVEVLARIEQAIRGPGPTPASRDLRLSIFSSGDLDFTKDIRDALTNELKGMGYVLDRNSVNLAGPIEPPFRRRGRSGPLTPRWRGAVEQLVKRGEGADLIVTVGTQATLALKSHYGENFGMPGKSPPVVFLGVTYPVASHVVDSLYSRYEKREVAGVAYGADGLRSIAALVLNWVLPGRPLKFVYFDEFPQDREAAAQLKKTRLYAEGDLLVESVTPGTFRRALKDEETTYFSWYTFETIFESHEPRLVGLAELLRSRRVVATTRNNCYCGYAFAAVSADDRSIGSTGAELIHRWRAGLIPRLGHHPIAIPRVGYWVNEEVARHRGVKLPPDVLARAWTFDGPPGS